MMILLNLHIGIFNLDGSAKLVNFLFDWNPPHLIYRIGEKLFRRLIDANNFASIEEISHLDLGAERHRNQYLIMALAHELLDVGRFPDVKTTRQCLDFLASKSIRISTPVYQYKDTTLSALISLIEACAANKLSKTKILHVLNRYVPKRASRLVSDNYITEERDNYLRVLALRCILEKNLDPDLDKLVPKEFIDKKKKSYRYEDEIREFKEKVRALLPWYVVRARILVEDIDDLTRQVKMPMSSQKRHGDKDIEILIVCPTRFLMYGLRF